MELSAIVAPFGDAPAANGLECVRAADELDVRRARCGACAPGTRGGDDADTDAAAAGDDATNVNIMPRVYISGVESGRVPPYAPGRDWSIDNRF